MSINSVCAVKKKVGDMMNQLLEVAKNQVSIFTEQKLKSNSHKKIPKTHYIGNSIARYSFLFALKTIMLEESRLRTHFQRSSFVIYQQLDLSLLFSRGKN